MGNVLTTISDRKIPTDTNTNDVVDYFVADILTASDYYPFGMPARQSHSGGQLTNRTYSAGEYRFGFNGMEKDDEVKGSGNSYTTEFRQYDPRIGRWFSLDPKMHYDLSSYCALDNNPIRIIDQNGADGDDPESLQAMWKLEQKENGDKTEPTGNDIVYTQKIWYSETLDGKKIRNTLTRAVVITTSIDEKNSIVKRSYYKFKVDIVRPCCSKKNCIYNNEKMIVEETISETDELPIEFDNLDPNLKKAAIKVMSLREDNTILVLYMNNYLKKKMNSSNFIIR